MYFVYTKLRTPAQVYKAGTCVHRKGGDEFSGKITRFLVERMGGSGQKPPTSLLLPKQARAYAVVRLYPTDYHNNADRFVDLTRLSSLNVMTEHAFNIKMTHLKKRLPCRIVCRFYSDGKEFSPDEPIPLTDLTRGGKVDIQALFESASGDVLTEKKVYDGQEIRAQQEVKLLGESQYTPTQDMVVPSYTTKGDRNSERAKSERGFWFYTHVTAPCELLVACESSLVKEMYQQTLVFAAGEVANVKVDVLTPKVSLSDCIEIRCTYMDKNNNMCLLPDDSQLDRYIPEAFGDNVRTLTYSVPEDRSYITLEVGVQGKVDQQGTRAVIKLLFTHLNKEKTTKATLYPGRPRCVELCEGESPTFYNKQPLPPLRLKITDKYGNLCRFKRKELQPLLFAIQSKDIPDPMHIIYANSSGELVDTPAITFHPVVRAPKTMKIAIALLDAEKLRKTSPTSSVKTRADAAKIVDGRKCGLHATILPGPDPCIVRLALRGLAVDFSSDSLEVSKEELLELVGRSNETFDDIAVTVLTESGDEVDLGKVPHFKAEQGHKNVTKFVKQHGKLPALSGPSRAPGQHVHSFTFRLGDTRVSAHVQIVAEPGALAQLQVHGQLGEVHRRMTVSKANPLVVRGLDEDENTVPLKAEDIDLTGDINNTTMKKEVLKTGEVALYGFSVNSSPGQTQLDVHNTAANLHTKHALQVLPGIPHAVAVFEQGDESAVDPGSELTVEANAELFSEIRVRVVDADGHHCTYLTSGVVAITTSKKDINLTAEPSALQTQLHDAEATFKHVSLSGKPGTTNIIFHLKTSAPVAGGSKTKFKLGGALRVRMTEDMSTPAKIKFPTAENDELPAITAGEAFSFPVQVVSKGGDVVMPSVLEQLGFSLAAKGLQAHMNSTRSVLLACSPSEDNINLIVQAPDPLTTTGRVAIKLQLRAGKKRLTAKTVVAVHPSAPVAVAAAEGVEPASVIALAPNGSPGRLFPSVTFLLKDQYGNTVPAEADMPCRLSLQQENGEGELELQPTTTPFSNSTQVNAVARTAFPPGQYTFTAAGPEGVKPLQRIIQVLDSRKDAKVSAQQRHEKKLVMDNLNRSLAQQQQKLRATKAAFEKFSQLRKIKATIEDILRHHIRSRRRTALRAEDLLRHPDACAELIAQRTSSRRRGGREPQQVPARFRGQDVLGFVGELLEAEDQMSQRLASYALGSHINSIICVRRETALKLQRSYSVRDIERLPRQPFRQDTPSAVARFGGRALSSYITPRVNDERLFGLLNRMLHGLYVFKDMDTAVAFRDARDQADRADSRRSSRGQPTARELSFRTLFTQDMRKVDSLGFFGGRSGQVPPLDKLHGCVWLKAEESNELRALRAAQPYCDNFFTVQAELADFDKDEATLQREIESLQAHGQALMTELRNIGGLPTDPRTQRPQAAAPHASGGDGNPQKRHKP
ncbi:hypothetical protein PTSG_08498 [Salpingoeca rosetta]|uniref:SMC hinge domain-containing protein n=1 Tax=Salpingoeca rosetta (strain ATCC 50818 / BSB-021) TaxID=946362 RepID=F2UJV3_SALR5|nr:uncharacterized protein PTSG_08498 [Salpingoeca rosetta]EGD77402.1 hypothetical protein PTSG_08498 [Salpingoeca rosetta]|eukprot:XP_004990746.1 hypothetical protein PTSG_08498 [Salpingoeca rosetta]